MTLKTTAINSTTKMSNTSKLKHKTNIMNISERILKTIKKIALERNIPEDDVTYNQIAVEQAIELNNLFELRKVGVSLPTHKELLSKMDNLVEKNYSKQTEIEKANFRIGWQECFSWIALKNVYENG